MTQTIGKVSFRRRLGALLYDAIAATTLAYFAAFIPVVAAGGVLAPGNALFSAYLLLVIFAYFAMSWTRGKTLGMQAWKFEIVRLDGSRPDLRTCAIRFAAAALSAGLCGAGYLAALASRERVTWHDRWSRTRMVSRLD